MKTMTRKILWLIGRRPRLGEQGQSIVEFGIASPFLVFMSVGVFAVGLMLDRHLTLTQVVRNAGNMYARGIDFSSTQNKNFIVDAASGLDLHLNSGGSTAVYMSRLTRVPDDAICDTGGGPRDCNNNGEVVISQRYMVGDSAAGGSMDSHFGMPTQFLDAAGNPATEGDHLDFYDLTEARATNLPGGMTGLREDELIYAIEIIHRPISLKFPGVFAPDIMYSRGFF